jgi:hypothetical protein
MSVEINYWIFALRVLILLLPAIVLWILDLAAAAHSVVYRFMGWLADND